MTLNNNILHSSGLHQKNNHVRPQKLDQVGSRRDFIEQKLVKQSSLPDGKCPAGTRWHRKLAQCINSDNIKLLQQKKTYVPQKRGDSEAKSVLTDALRAYGKTDKI